MSQGEYSHLSGCLQILRLKYFTLQFRIRQTQVQTIMNNQLKSNQNSPKNLSGFRLALLIVFLFSPIVSITNAAQDQSKKPPIKIGVLHVNTPTGNRFLAGVKAAMKDTKEEFEIVPLSYTDAAHGTELLIDTIKNEKVQILIGPTESDVFIRALEQRSELEQHSVPVISPLVTADISHVRSGWFFLTNVDLRRRAQTTYDFLNKYWVSSIAILYANTEFGRRAERAFSAELTTNQLENYVSLGYALPAINARPHVRNILQQKPEAVGIFGEREDIEQIMQMLHNMNKEAIPYRPILFTVIDARSLKDIAKNLYFVSVTDINNKVLDENILFDDVMSLAFDTTKLIIKEIKKLNTDMSSAEGRKKFRDKFETVLQTYPAQEDNISGMSFSYFKNVAVPKLYKIEDNKNNKNASQIIEVPLDNSIGLGDKLRFKLNLLGNRFGYIPWLNAALIVFIIIVMSIIDLKKWYAGNVLYLLIPSSFYILLAVNSTLVVGLYVYMGETGAIRYDSTLAALMLAFAPIALLRTNFFETSTGKTLGLAKLYDAFLQWVNDRLMIAGHNLTKLYVDLIAYHNTVDGMRDYLRDIYSGQPNAERRIKLTTELSQLVNDSIPYVTRRKICARLLLRTMNWKELRADSMAPVGRLPENSLGRILHKLDVWWYGRLNGPEEAKKYEEEKYCISQELLQDPESLIRMAARHCARNETARQKLQQLVDGRLAEFTDEDRKKDLENEFHKDIKGVIGEQARLRRQISFLFIIRGYDAKQLKEDLCMDSDGNAITEKPVHAS